MQHFIYPCGRTMRGLKVGAKLNILIHSRNFLSKKNYYNAKCLVRKSVDRQIQHFLVKCVKKTKILGRISDFGNQCLAQQRKKFQSD